MKTRIKIITILLAIAVSIGNSSVFAAKIKWRNVPYTHYSQEEPIKDLLADFFSSQGIGLICSENISGKVSGDFNESNPSKFFRNITSSYNLVWYYDGAAVFVYPAHEITSQVLNPSYMKIDRFKNTLETLDVLDNRFGLKIVEEERIIFVSGPERYVELVADIVEKLDTKAKVFQAEDDIVKIFPLKHAWAEDKTFIFREREMTIPGVATMIRNLIWGKTSPKDIVEDANNEGISDTVSKLKGTGLARKKNRNESDSSNTAPDNQESGPSSSSTGMIQADTRQNAIIVRDREEKMPYYKKMIEMLDVPVGLVEIQATIMDVDRDNLENLGVNWLFKVVADNDQNVFTGALNGANLAENASDLMASGLEGIPGTGISLATVIGDSRDFFMARVNALQKKGDAEILSRPSVLTLNNMEAQLEHSETFYVKVAGNEEVDLFDITAGVVLRVTPHIITEGENDIRVKLAIQIEDGEFSENTEFVDNIPVVKKSVINTQAIVKQKQSLLIGGYKKERKVKNENQVPCLGGIPVIGWLFKQRTTVDSNTERLFLITPTIVPRDNLSTYLNSQKSNLTNHKLGVSKTKTAGNK